MEDEEDVITIRRYVRNMPRHNNENVNKPGLVPYIPKSLYSRHREVQRRAWLIRNGENPKATKVWISSDFELRVRAKNNDTPWSQISPEVFKDLPIQDPRKERDHGDRGGKPETPMDEGGKDVFNFPERARVIVRNEERTRE